MNVFFKAVGRKLISRTTWAIVYEIRDRFMAKTKDEKDHKK